tara:strand:- start:54 stop:245 length:192 start_codon:yes stop_codon:yes gene_type:complete
MSCPICKRAATVDHRPFCSRRCADVDLAKWLNGSYAVPSIEPDDIESALEAAQAATQEPQKPH